MHESYPRVISSSIIQVMKNWNNNFKNITALQNMEHELAVMLTDLPKEDQKLLVKVNLKVPF